MEQWNDITEFVIKAQNGDNEAIGKLYDKCSEHIYKRARYMLRTDEDAQDATQEVFIDIIKSLNTLQEPKAFISWINKILLYKCYRYYDKKEYKTVTVPFDETIDNDAEFVDDNEESVPPNLLEKTETKEALQKIINSLPKEQKNAVIMYYFYRLKVSEIAEIMECTQGTVKSRLNYARKEVQKQIEDKRKKGIMFPAIVPLPFIAHLVRAELERIRLSEQAAVSMAEAIAEDVSKNAEKQAAVAEAAKPAMTMLAKAIIGVSAAAVVTVGAMLIYNQATSRGQPAIEEQAAIENETPENSQQSGVENSNGIENNEVNGQSEATYDGEVAPVTDADFARLYYDFVQNTLKSRGSTINGLPFIDADMFDYKNDGKPDLVASFEGGHIEVYEALDFGDVVEVKFSRNFSAVPAHGSDMVEGSNIGAAYLLNYDGKTYLVRYSTYINIIDADAFKPHYEIQFFDVNSPTGTGHSFSNWVQQDSDNIIGSFDESTLSSDVANSLLEEFTTPATTWGAVVGDNDSFGFINTGGERLKDYFTE